MKEKDLSEKKGYIFEERGALADQARAQSFKMNVDSLKRLEEIKTQLLNGTYEVPLSDVAERLISRLFLFEEDIS